MRKETMLRIFQECDDTMRSGGLPDCEACILGRRATFPLWTGKETDNGLAPESYLVLPVTPCVLIESLAGFVKPTNIQETEDGVETFRQMFDEASRLQKTIIMGLAGNFERLRYMRMHRRLVALRPRLVDVDKDAAATLLGWIQSERAEDFPELQGLSDWGEVTWDNITDDFIARLAKLAAAGPG